MTTLRTAAQQALDALVSQFDGRADAINILSAALEQPERKPLTDEEMRSCAHVMDAEPLAEGWSELIKFARAIERAHGIGGSDE